MSKSYPFILPDYQGKSIINLMSSIAGAFGKKHDYPELDSLSSEFMKTFDNVVLFVVDGLGDVFLSKQRDSFLFRQRQASMTSTFLSTTTCANTAFLVGYPPQQHGLTAWDIFLKEVGAMVAFLPFETSFGAKDLRKDHFDLGQIMDFEAFHDGFNGSCYSVIFKKYAFSAFNSYVSRAENIIPARNYPNIFTKVKNLVKTKAREKRFIHTYIPEFDSLCHQIGPDSEGAKILFQDLDSRMQKLAQDLKGTNTLLLITADHGQTEVPADQVLWLEDFAGLSECLSMPLLGEFRVRYCYVRAHKTAQFEEIVQNKLSKYCWCFPSSQIIQDNLFGLGKPHLKLAERVGDYILVMKDHYILRDKLGNFDPTRKNFIGNHGGVSEEEMMVSLITINC
ncbi:MAG TPA: alkaline phosphatase family protein [Candidatus Gracilibacteria bacterium]|nr:alkaline phosphatase family protein [Candidatus Gracilibacteria bacterium]